MAKARTRKTGRLGEAASLRWAADFLCLWRLCRTGACQRAHACHGRVYLCAKRNYGALPEGVRGYFNFFIAAKTSGVDFESFEKTMNGRDETKTFLAWRKAAHASRV